MTKRIISLLLVICMVVSLMPISVLAQEIAISSMVLDCPYVVHEHSEECYDESGNLVCGQVDYVFHKHDHYCYDSDGNLVCLLDEVEDDHIHNLNDCYDEDANLVCEYSKVGWHQHSFGCFRTNKKSVNAALGADGLTSKTGYISNLNVSMKDGIGTFDSKGDLAKDDEGAPVKDEFGNYEIDYPGYDSNDNNNVVRSFDDISYVLGANFSLIDDESKTKEVNLKLQVDLDKDITEASFKLSSMSWLFGAGTSYEVNCYGLDKDGEEVWMAYQTKEGYFDVKTNKKIDINDYAKDNNNYKEDADGNYIYDDIYKTQITRQQLIVEFGYVYEDDGIASMELTTGNIQIAVLAAEHGTVVAPEFKLCVVGNEDNICNYEGEFLSSNTIKSEDVVVSAAESYNMQLRPNFVYSSKGWFDFGSKKAIQEGDKDYIAISDTNILDALPKDFEVTQVTVGDDFYDGVNTYEFLEWLGKKEINYGKTFPSEFVIPVENGSSIDLSNDSILTGRLDNIRYGRLQGVGVALQLYSEPGKGMKGLSLPAGDINLDLMFSTKVTTQSSNHTENVDDPQSYTPILWEYNEAVYAEAYNIEINNHVLDRKNQVGIGKFGRQYVVGNGGIQVPSYQLPLNYKINPEADGCYYGGDWKYLGINGNNNSEAPMPSTNGGRGNGLSYNFKVSDYDFDLNDYYFPTRACAGANESPDYKDYQKNFSVGYVQILCTCPRTLAEDVTDTLTVAVNNMSITSRSGSTLTYPEDDKTNKVGNEQNTTDNLWQLTVELLKPGAVARRNSFNRIYFKNNKEKQTSSIKDEYLGGDVWNSGAPDYNCSAYAGDDIAIFGFTGLEGSDYRIESLNLLQLFDKSFTIKRVEEGKERQKLKDYNEGTYASKGTYKDQAEEDAEVAMCFDGNPDINDFGDVNYLYAIDPQYPDGYDTSPGSDYPGSEPNATINDMGDLEYMNTVQEEDLIFFDTLAELDAFNAQSKAESGIEYACVGVLAEVRNASSKCNYYLKIQVHIDDSKDLVGKTIVTMNTIRIWGNAEDGYKFGDDQCASWVNQSILPRTVEGSIDYGNINYQELAQYNADNTQDFKNTVEGYKTPEQDYGFGKFSANVHNAKESSPGVYDIPYYEKTYYYNNMKNSQGHKGSARIGNSLHIMEYKLTVDINNVKEDINGNENSIDNSYTVSRPDDRLVKYKIEPFIEVSQDDKDANNTKTDVIIDINLDETPYGDVSRISLIKNEGKVVCLVNKDNPGDASFKEELELSADSENPTSVYVIHKEKLCELKVYAVYYAGDPTRVQLVIKDVPVGEVDLPIFWLSAELNPLGDFGDIGDSASPKKIVSSSAGIYGEGYNRGYDVEFGNKSITEFKVDKLAATTIVKTVNTDLIELDGEIEYKVKYYNDSEEDVESIYLYDILPYSGDDNGTKFVDGGGITLTDLDVNLAGSVTSADGFKYDLYYSTTPVSELNSKIQACRNDANNFDSVKLDTMLSSGKDEVGDPLFKLYTSGDNVEGATCIFATINKLGKKLTAEAVIRIKTNDNQAGDIYRNQAVAWIKGKNIEIISNIVTTEVVSRSISGLVWHDADWDGERYIDKNATEVKDESEETLENVKVMLFAQVETDDPNEVIYKLCTKDIRGNEIGPNKDGVVTTGSDGTYKFEDLPAGNYVVMFSNPDDKKTLDVYKNATLYQTENVSQKLNNDSQLGVLSGNENTGFQIVYADPVENPEYEDGNVYFTKFSSTEDTIRLHTIEEMKANNVLLDDFVEHVDHMDLGLVDYTLRYPQVGGEGTIMFIFGGALLMVATMVAGLIIFSKKKKQTIN